MEKSPEPRPPRVTDRPGRQRSPMMRHRSSKPATLLLLLALLPWSPPSAAALGTTLKAWLRLGKYRETVATKVATLHPHGDIWGLAFSPDGRLLAASSPHTGSVQLWDWRHDRLVRRLQKAPGWDIMATTPLAFSPDGRLLASCHDGTPHSDIVIRLWDPQTGAVVRDIRDPVNGWGCLAVDFTPQGHSLVRLVDPNPSGVTLMVYSTRTWQVRWGLRTPPFTPNTLALSPDGHRAALGGDTLERPRIGAPYFQEQIVLVNLERHAVTRTIPTFPRAPPRLLYGQLVPVVSNPASALAWSPGGTELAVGQWGVDPGGSDAVRIYNVHSGAVVAREPGPLGIEVYALCYSPGGKYLVESGLVSKGVPVIEIWDGGHHHLLQKIPGSAGSLAVSRNGHYLAMGGDGKMLVWRLH